MASARLESSEEVSNHQEDSEADLETIQRELELLNSNGDVINVLESKLIQAKAQNRKDHATFKERLEAMKKKDSNTIAKCESLVKAKNKMTEMQDVLNSAVASYDKANSQHSAAKELIQVAELQLSTSHNVDGVTMDQAWQETLNHATERVVETALDKSRAEQEHKTAADEFAKAHFEYNELYKKLQKFFEKAKPYYVECSKCNAILKNQKDVIKDLERQIKEAKASYSGALKALDTLSCSIHEKRRATVTSRLKHFEEPDQTDYYHGSNDRLSYTGEFEASVLNSVPSSSCLLNDEHEVPHDLPPSSQGGLSKSSSSSSTSDVVMERVVGGLVANALDAALQSYSGTPIHACNHPSSPPDLSGHHGNKGSPGTPGRHDNIHPCPPPGHRGVFPPLLSNPLIIVSHDQSGDTSDHKNASDCSSATPCQNPASGCPALSSDQSHQHDVISDTPLAS